jgi:CubicO group peptidase (beta-lactamase class C family)
MKPLSYLKTIPLVAVIFLLSVAAQSFAQSGLRQEASQLKTVVSKQDLIARLEKRIPELMSEGQVQGLSIALIKDAQLIWHRGFGIKNAGTKEPVTDRTIFEAASLSKPLFAYAVLKLVDSGKLDLDAPLSKYLPAYLDNDERLGQITARRVLSHTTGFPNWRQAGPLAIHFTPGERFSYSGEGFVYLQKVVERITGEPLEEHLKKSVFAPLRMTESSFVWREAFEAQAAAGHNSAGIPQPKGKPLTANAAGGLHTTAGDYAKFVIAIMNGEGLKRATLAQMLTPQIKLNPDCVNCLSHKPARLTDALSWGLGWGLEHTRDAEAFWHWGDNNGVFRCFALGLKRERAGLVVFTNSAHGLSIMPEIVSEAIGGSHPAFAWINYEPYNSPGRRLLKAILDRGVDAAVKEYRAARERDPRAATISESQMNAVGYRLLGMKKLREAIEVFQLNVEAYPASFNVYDSLGEAFMESGDKELAIKYYKKSVELNPNNTNGIEMLKKLQGN